jgi:hypothetical protein
MNEKTKSLDKKNLRNLETLLLSLFSQLIRIADHSVGKCLGVIFFFIPVGIYFFFVIYFSENIPFMDDYDAILKFVIDFAGEESFLKRIQLVFAQHNDHRLAFLHLVVLAQYYVSGVINFQYLIILGNLSVIAILFVLWKSFDCSKNKLYHFLPVVYLLFSLAYFEASLWAMVSLSGLSVVALSFAAIYLLGKDKNSHFIGSCVFATAAVFTQGNGKIVLICCIAMLLYKKQYKKSVIWFVMSLLLLLLPTLFLDSTHNSYASISEILQSPIRHIRHYLSIFSFLGTYFESLTFLGTYSGILAFMGTYFGSIILTLIVGAVISCCFIYLIQIKFYNKNLVLFVFITFIFLNALAVGYARPSVVFPSRYAIYSTLVIAILYLTLNEIRKGITSRLILTCAAVWIFIGSAHQYVTAPLKLKYYVITVKNYEKDLVLNKYFKDSMNQEQASQTLEVELLSIKADPLVSLLPDSQISEFIIHSHQNTFKIMHGNFAYTSPFSNSLKAADKLKVYEIGNMLPKLK